MSGKVPALRVVQLDATELDDSALSHLSTQLKACLKHRIFNYDLLPLEPYLRTSMYTLLLYFTLWKNGQTIGQSLLRTRFGDEKTLATPSKIKLLALQGILILEVWMKVNSSHGGSRYLSSNLFRRITNVLESSYSFLQMLNFFLFLRRGNFHTLWHRVTGLKTVYVDPNPRQRLISFDLMSREVLWHGFAECAVFFLSLANVAKLRRNVTDFLFPKSSPHDVEVFDSCAFCSQLPMLPHEGACRKHAYCYYCVSTALDKDRGCKCPTCKFPIESISPLRCLDIEVN